MSNDMHNSFYCVYNKHVKCPSNGMRCVKNLKIKNKNLSRVWEEGGGRGFNNNKNQKERGRAILQLHR